MKTWFDIEPLLDRIETLDKATLEEFANVQPPPSQNPAFHHKFDHAIQRIRNRLSEINSIEKPAPYPPTDKTNQIHNIGVGVIVVVLGACALWAIGHYLGLHLAP